MECTAESSVPNNSLTQYKGIVQSIAAGIVKVSLVPDSLCGSCKAQAGGCHAGLAKQKAVIVELKSKLSLTEGQMVTLVQASQKSMSALALVFIVPIVLLCSGLVLATYLAWSELLGGLLGLGLLTVYFAVLYPVRKKITQHFEFELYASDEHELS